MLVVRVKGMLDIPESAGALVVDSEDFQIDNHALYTNAASACIVLNAFNLRTHQDLLLHMSEIVPETKDEMFSSHDEFIDATEAFPSLGNPKDMYFWLGGGMPVMKGRRDVVEPNRLFAAQCVRSFMARYSLPANRLCEDWSPPGTCIDVALYCSIGVLTVASYPDEE